MNNINFPHRWPAQYPDRIQLYSLATPNGQKIGIMLEETKLLYEPHRIDILQGAQFDEDYIKINPNSKIPSIIDPNGPAGNPMVLMESGAILLYLAEKANCFLPQAPAARWETIQWLFFQMASIGPFFGQFGHFYKYARDKTKDDYGIRRYGSETQRLLTVLNKRLADRHYIAGDEYTIADIATLPWVNGLDFYEGKDYLQYDRFKNIHAWVDRCMARPGVTRGMAVCSLTE